MLLPPPTGRLSSSGDKLGCQGWGEGNCCHLQMNSPSTQAFSAEFTVSMESKTSSPTAEDAGYSNRPVLPYYVPQTLTYLSNGDPITWLSSQGCLRLI